VRSTLVPAAGRPMKVDEARKKKGEKENCVEEDEGDDEGGDEGEEMLLEAFFCSSKREENSNWSSFLSRLFIFGRVSFWRGFPTVARQFQLEEVHQAAAIKADNGRRRLST